LFVKLRNRMAEFSKKRIDQLVREYIKRTLEDDEKCKISGKHKMGDLYVLGCSSVGRKEEQPLGMSMKH